MLKSKKEILDEVGNMVDMVGTLYDERESIWRKYCKCSRDLKLTEEELADKNFRLEKAIKFIKSFEYYIPEDDKPKLLEMLEGANNE